MLTEGDIPALSDLAIDQNSPALLVLTVSQHHPFFSWRYQLVLPLFLGCENIGCAAKHPEMLDGRLGSKHGMMRDQLLSPDW